MFAKANLWTIPVPVSTLSAQPLHAAHAGYAIRVDLARIGSFAFGPSRHADVALADLQLNADGNVELRLGSGRAVTYAGAYIKGVGRTQLAANWRSERELYHSSGHLFPTGAVREYLVSRHLAARGMGARIVPCEGLLFAKAPAAATGLARRVASMVAGGAPAPIDTKLQALSVKPARFGRLSNVLYAVSRIGAHDSLAPVLRAFRAILDGEDASAPVDAKRCTPSELADALKRSVERSLAAFLAYPQAGVFFWSFHNNFTADGRFLDLETPVVMGTPFAGVLTKRGESPEGALLHSLPVPGIEVVELASQVRAFLDALDGHLARITRASRLTFPLASSYAAQLREALEAAFPETHPVRSVEALEAMFEAALAPAFGWSPSQAAWWRSLMRARLAMRVGGEIEHVTGTYREVPIELGAVEPGLAVQAWSVDGSMPDAKALEPGRVFADALRFVDAQTEVEPALEAVRVAARMIEESTAQAPNAQLATVAS